MKKIFSVLIAVCFILTGHSRAQEDYVKRIEEQRRQKDKEFATSELSPLSPVAHFHFETGSPLTVSLSEAGAKEGALPDAHHLLKFSWQDNMLFVESMKEGQELTINGSPVQRKTELQPGKAAKICHFALTYSRLSETTARILVYDLNSEARQKFKGLNYFPVNPSFRVKAKLIKIAKPDEVKILTHLNLLRTYLRYAYLEFELHGEKCRLTAFKMPSSAGPGKLFIIFKDKTSGNETYSMGRFLEAEEEGDECILDFNLAYNPLCAYNPHWNCPLPPQENWLKVRIEAGEKTYKKEE